MDSNPIRNYARVRAHMLVTKLFLVGLVCIHWSLLVGGLTFVVLLYVERSLTQSYYDYFVEHFDFSFETLETDEIPHDEEESG